MTKWSDEVGGGGNYISTKIGTDVTLTIKAINKVTNKPEYEPKKLDDTRQGFVFEFVGEEGIVTASTYTLQGALKDADIDIGDTVNIKHPKQGEYIVTKIVK